MDLISLTETEFFRKLTDGENDNLHIAYKGLLCFKTTRAVGRLNMTLYQQYI